jgi:hypothetical protein
VLASLGLTHFALGRQLSSLGVIVAGRGRDAYPGCCRSSPDSYFLACSARPALCDRPQGAQRLFESINRNGISTPWADSCVPE